MNSEEFFKVVEETFGEKVVVQTLTVKLSEDELSRLPWTGGEVKAYPRQAWVMGGICPVCGAKLGGLFGSFGWGLIHGEGSCTSCNKAWFRYYHYIVKGKRPLEAFALIGF